MVFLPLALRVRPDHSPFLIGRNNRPRQNVFDGVFVDAESFGDQTGFDMEFSI